jgi:hypothetical protein
MPEPILGMRSASMRAQGRRPGGLAREVRSLRDDHGVRIVRFEDDEFPLRRRWARELATELDRAELVGQVVWSIACRAEQVEAELFGSLRDAGLFLVSMREADAGATAVLKSLGLLYAYDLELREHVAFLRSVMSDGSAAPPVRSGAWRGLSQRLNRAWVEVTVIERLVGHLDGMARYRRELAALTATSNDELFRHLDESGADRVVAQLEEELARIRDPFLVRHQARVQV